MSQTGTITGSKIRAELYDSDGPFSLNSTESRDAVQKPSGNVAYSDFNNWCWSQGRGYGEQQSGDTIYPYFLDSRRDGDSIGGSGFRWSVNIVDGLPEWESYIIVTNSATNAGATTGQAYFISTSKDVHTLSFRTDTVTTTGTGGVTARFYVIEFDGGYLSGNRRELLPETRVSSSAVDREYIETFEPRGVGRWVVPVWVNRHTGFNLTGSDFSTLRYKVRKARITV